MARAVADSPNSQAARRLASGRRLFSNSMFLLLAALIQLAYSALRRLHPRALNQRARRESLPARAASLALFVFGLSSRWQRNRCRLMKLDAQTNDDDADDDDARNRPHLIGAHICQRAVVVVVRSDGRRHLVASATDCERPVGLLLLICSIDKQHPTARKHEDPRVLPVYLSASEPEHAAAGRRLAHRELSVRRCLSAAPRQGLSKPQQRLLAELASNGFRCCRRSGRRLASFIMMLAKNRRLATNSYAARAASY